MEQPKRKKGLPRRELEIVYLRTLEDGTGLTVEEVRSSTIEGHRFTVLLAPGSVSGGTLAFLDMLYRTFSDTAGQRICCAPESQLGKFRTHSE